jgi:hypothetical protein
MPQVSGGYAGSGPVPQHAPVHNPAHDTGQPYQAQPPQMGTAPPPQYGAHASGGYGAASDSLMMPARKSRAGLIIAIFLVLCAAGGAAAYFIVGGDKDKKDDPIASNDPDTDPTTDPSNNGTQDATDASSGGATVDVTAKPIDAGTPDAKSPVVPVDTNPVEPPQPVMITVLIESRPPGATIYKDGEKIGKTAKNVKVTKGETTTFVLKRSGYKDLDLAVDGTDDKLTGRLEKKGGKINHNNNTDPIVKPPVDPPKDECKRNPSLPQCMLE